MFASLQDPALIRLLIGGSVGVLPTDTLYGLVCCASDASAVEKLYKLKARENKPGTIVAASAEQLVSLGIKARYLKAVESYLLEAVSVVIPCFELSYLHLGKGAIAVRVSVDKELNRLLLETGPLLTTSANLPDKDPATNIAEAQEYFGDKIDFYVDGGNLSNRKPSTIIRVVDDAVEVLRAGAVKIDEETGKVLK